MYKDILMLALKIIKYIKDISFLKYNKIWIILIIYKICKCELLNLIIGIKSGIKMF